MVRPPFGAPPVRVIDCIWEFFDYPCH